MFNKKLKGFTLIELLVVIAIIGVLASIVLVSLGASRNRARDTRVITSISQVRSVAEMSNINSGNFNDICDPGNSNLGTVYGLDVLRSDISSNMPSWGSISCYAGSDSYCIAADLNIGGSFCISSDGVVKTVASSSDEICIGVDSRCGD